MLDGKIYKRPNEYLVKKDGTLLSVSMVVTPLMQNNSIIGTVVAFRDKTDLEKINFLEKEKSKNQEQIIYSMIEMIESRDSYTAGHTKRVANYCVLIAKEMGYNEEDIELLRNAAMLHDIGKISTPDSVLLKPNKLDDLEYELIQEHLTSGYEMLSKIDQYKTIANIMREHHEKYDGTGYPRGLKADEINPLSRVMMVADAFDAMTTNRVYKPRKSVKIALEELKQLSAKSYHPDVVSSSLKALKNIEIDSNISQLPKTMMEEQRFSYFYKDRLTNIFIIEYLELVLRYYTKTDSLYIYNIQLNNFSGFNKKFGWKMGDQFLIEFAAFLTALYSEHIIFRVEGDDFMILSEIKIENMQKSMNEFKRIKDTFVTCSVNEEYVRDIHKKFNI
jgi:putative nucleotidyltransferase with HDIG domain